MKDIYPKPTDNQTTPFSLLDAISRARFSNANARIAKEAEYRRRKEELQLSFEERREFIEASNSVPAPLATYALWLRTYLLQGNKITHPLDYPYPKPSIYPGEHTMIDELSSIGPTGALFVKSALSYSGQNVIWMPLRPFDNIPTAYGSASMTILITPELRIADANLLPTSEDERSGWEYGHTCVLRLQYDDTMPNGLRATTNQPDVIQSYPDVEEFILSNE